MFGSDTGTTSIGPVKSDRLAISSPISASSISSSRYMPLRRCRMRSIRPMAACRRAWMAENTTMPCSILARVVPTGTFWLLSDTSSMVVRTTPLPASTKNPRSWNSTADGGLNGRGMAILRTSSTFSPPSISSTCVGWILSDCPPRDPPFSFSMVCELEICALSMSARSAPVAAADRPPIMCVMPIGYAPRQGTNGNSTIHCCSSRLSSSSSQLRYMLNT